MFVRNLFCFIYLLISANVLLAFEKATYLPVYGKYDVLTNSLAENKFSIYYLSFLRVREDGSIYVDWGDDRASSHLKNFFSRDERCRWVVGGEKGSAYLSDVLSDTDSEKRLLKQLIQYVVDYNCEGVDIDWEFPSLNNGLVDPERMHDRVNFVHFACQLKEGLIQARRKAALSLSIPGNGGGIMLTGFDLLGLNQCVDYFNIMSYDRPTGDSFGRFHSAFYPDGNDAQSYRLSGLGAFRFLLSRGIEPEKIVLGIPFFGRMASYNGPVTKSCKQFEKFYSHPIGYDQLTTVFFSDPSWKKFRRVKHDNQPMLLNSKCGFSISYEDSVSVRAKYLIAKKLGMAGIVVWNTLMDTNDTLYNQIR